MTNISGWKGRLLEKISEVDENDWLNFVDTFELHASTALDVHVEYIGSVKGLEDPAFEDISLLDTVKEGIKIYRQGQGWTWGNFGSLKVVPWDANP